MTQFHFALNLQRCSPNKDLPIIFISSRHTFIRAITDSKTVDTFTISTVKLILSTSSFFLWSVNTIFIGKTEAEFKQMVSSITFTIVPYFICKTRTFCLNFLLHALALSELKISLKEASNQNLKNSYLDMIFYRTAVPIPADILDISYYMLPI